MARKPRASIQDRTKAALAKINQFTADGVKGYAEDSAELAKSLLQNNIASYSPQDPDARTGSLRESIKAERGDDSLSWSVATQAKNKKGLGYGAAQEYGWHTKDGKKMKGRFFIIRGTTGMLGRWKKGKRWNPEGSA